jgi:5-methylcytosine-specific restriction endonuclease McrA
MKGGAVMSDVLVLSKTWEPYDRVSWERAFVLLCGGDDGKKKVEVIEFDERTVRSGSLREWKVPSVIRFVGAMTPEIRSVKFSRENIYARDKGQCQYCGTRVKVSEFEYEHVIPRAQGGKTTWENIVVACTSCNQRKGGRTPLQAGLQLRSIPRRPDKSFARRRLTLGWREGMPESWRSYMRDVTYWRGELESDDGG